MIILEKTCSKCGLKQELDNFNKDIGGKNGRCAQCKGCRKKHRAEHALETKEYNLIYRKNNKEKIKELKTKYRKNYKEKIKLQRQEHYNKNKKRENERSRSYKRNNKEKINIQKKKWRTANRDRLNKNKNERYRKDIHFKLACNLRIRINHALKNNQKSGSAIDDLGCSVKQLKQHLENQFYSHLEVEKVMSWDNYGLRGWHIDHIIPLDAFNLTDRKQFLKACHYTNLQPLWAEENIRKGNKL